MSAQDDNDRDSSARAPRGFAAGLQTIGHLLPAALYTCDAPHGRIMYFNSHAARLWGRTPALGQTDEVFCGSFKLWRPDGSALPHHETPMARAVLEGVAARNEEVIIERPNGSRIAVVVNIDPVFDDAGRLVGAINVFHETTMVVHIAEARARLAAIVDSSDDAIISIDLQGIIRSWNKGAERLFGYAAAEVVGRPVIWLLPPERQAEENEILDRIRCGERVRHYETVRVRNDGAHIPISLSVSPIVNDDGVVIGASKIARDISELNRLLRAAESARREAEAANRSKDEFLAMLGHELRNPLAAIRNAVAAATLDETQRARALEIARRQTDQLATIVDDLLDVARITRGWVTLRKAPISLVDVLKRAVDGAEPLMQERGHSLELNVPAEQIYVEADAARLEQAVTNLLSNSAKYTDPGGRVEVTAEARAGRAVIRVRDNGIGIAPDILPRVFDLFTQGARALDRAQGGLGIGLTLVRRIVELHGGAIEAMSAGPGAGTEIVIDLPALPSRASIDVSSAPVSEPLAPPELRSGTRVLMVEDNVDAAESLAMILDVLGHHTRVVHDAAAALEAAHANVPDVMLIDIGLPGMNGYDLAKAIRADRVLERVVLVALTGYGRPEDNAEAIAAGFDYHLVKPVDINTLGGLVAGAGSGALPSAVKGRPRGLN